MANEQQWAGHSQSSLIVHDLKIAPSYFDAVFAGVKPFEIRKDNRGFAVGDTVRLREWKDGYYTGDVITRRISYILRGEPFLKHGYCCMGIQYE